MYGASCTLSMSLLERKPCRQSTRGFGGAVDSADVKPSADVTDAAPAKASRTARMESAAYGM